MGLGVRVEGWGDGEDCCALQNTEWLFFAILKSLTIHGLVIEKTALLGDDVDNFRNRARNGVACRTESWGAMWCKMRTGFAG
jgi:hypothetical protein